jgi:hypothetical protein
LVIVIGGFVLYRLKQAQDIKQLAQNIKNASSKYDSDLKGFSTDYKNSTNYLNAAWQNYSEEDTATSQDTTSSQSNPFFSDPFFRQFFGQSNTSNSSGSSSSENAEPSSSSISSYSEEAKALQDAEKAVENLNKDYKNISQDVSTLSVYLGAAKACQSLNGFDTTSLMQSYNDSLNQTNTINNAVYATLTSLKSPYAWLGVEIGDDGDMPMYLLSWNIEGAYVASVIAGGPADNAGIQQDDIITAWDAARITNMNDFLTKIHKTTPGTTVTLTIWRQVNGTNNTLKIPVSLGETPFNELSPAQSQILSEIPNDIDTTNTAYSRLQSDQTNADQTTTQFISYMTGVTNRINP